MTGLTKAYLAEITSGNSPTELPDTKVDVQFNPTTLRVQISNKTAGGQQAGAQARQRPGTGEMQVSFDLVFDSADEGDTEQGVSVLEKTKMVERFVRPRGPRAGQEAPPRVAFAWGSFYVQGTMESANTDIDLFDDKGVPLRAKVSVSIKGQDPRWTYTPSPAAAMPGSSAGGPGGGAVPGSGTTLPPGAPGTQGNGLSPNRIVQAMPGESLAQLASRAGYDPSAWRALADGLANPLKLELGQEVPVPANAGRGAAAGNTAQGTEATKMANSLPLVNPAQTPKSGEGGSGAARRGGAPDLVRQGRAVTSQGGLQQSIAQIKTTAHHQDAGASLAAFGFDAGTSADATDRPWGRGIPLRPRFGGGGGGRNDVSGSLASAPPLPAARWSHRSGCGCRNCNSRGQPAH